MILNLNENSFFVFDLDDTLYNEIDFLKSGYKIIAKYLEPLIQADIFPQMIEKYTTNAKDDIFQWVVESYSSSIEKKQLLDIYRSHIPSITLNEDSSRLIMELTQNNIKMGIITDGRSVTQRNKLKSLGIINNFSELIISEEFGSEKPAKRNYQYFELKYPNYNFYFFGDNPEKDFTAPLELGWKTFCLLDRGENIHPQNLSNLINTNISLLNSFDDLHLHFEL